jgi:hypothetical protein
MNALKEQQALSKDKEKEERVKKEEERRRKFEEGRSSKVAAEQLKREETLKL